MEALDGVNAAIADALIILWVSLSSGPSDGQGLSLALYGRPSALNLVVQERGDQVFPEWE